MGVTSCGGAKTSVGRTAIVLVLVAVANPHTWLVSSARVAGSETEPAAMTTREARTTHVLVADPSMKKPAAKSSEQMLWVVAWR